MACEAPAERSAVGALITGSVGAGKSTLLRQLAHLASTSAANALAEPAAAATALVPLLIPAVQVSAGSDCLVIAS